MSGARGGGERARTWTTLDHLDQTGAHAESAIVSSITLMPR